MKIAPVMFAQGLPFLWIFANRQDVGIWLREICYFGSMTMLLSEMNTTPSSNHFSLVFNCIVFIFETHRLAGWMLASSGTPIYGDYNDFSDLLLPTLSLSHLASVDMPHAQLPR